MLGNIIFFSFFFCDRFQIITWTSYSGQTEECTQHSYDVVVNFFFLYTLSVSESVPNLKKIIHFVVDNFSQVKRIKKYSYKNTY